MKLANMEDADLIVAIDVTRSNEASFGESFAAFVLLPTSPTTEVAEITVLCNCGDAR
jgi:hypothetical protein